MRTASNTRSTSTWRPTTAQWIALDVAFWAAIALLYGAQWTLRSGVRDPGALARLVVTQLVSFATASAGLTPTATSIAYPDAMRGGRRGRPDGTVIRP